MRSRMLLNIALFASLATAACADWQDHKDLPDWARRGYAQWGHGANINGRIKWGPGGYGIDVPNVRLLLYCGRNIQQTISYLTPEAEALAREGGLRRQPYICSQTVWWQSEETQTPELTQAVRLGLDGKPIIIYGNPARHCGCYNAPFWLEYTQRKIKRTLADGGGHVDSIFFDNPVPYDCYCPRCRDGFRAFTTKTFGVAMDLAHADAEAHTRFARALFQAESAQEFFRRLKAYARSLDPTLTISPNLGVGSAISTYLTAYGATDMVFCEEGFRMPPWESTVGDYKLGLAASHGLATGQLLGLSEMLRRARALSLEPGNELGILESFYYPEEHKLADAEALACDGTYIESFALREQKITIDDLPHHVAVREALHQYATFEQAHRDLYDLAQPGSRIAVVNSIWSELAGSGGRAAFRSTCEALSRAGLPYEVLVEDDLTPALLAAYRLVIVPQVRSLAAADAGALLEFVRGGGAVVRTGDLAAGDRLDRPYSPETRPELARLPAGEPQAVGKGWFWYPPRTLDKYPPAELWQLLEKLSGTLDCRISPPSPKLFANMLRTRDGKATTIHLVNSDFTFAEMPSADIRDDSGWPRARTYFADTRSRARKTLLVPDPTALKTPVLRFFGNSCWGCTDKITLVVTCNGQDLAALKGSALHETKWYEVPVPPGLIRTSNEVVFRVTGEPSGHPDWFALKLDTEATTRRSSWSVDDGKTWTEADLSLDGDVQTGEYLVRLGAAGAENAVAKPEDFMGKCQVRPARDIAVIVRRAGAAPVARLISPDGPETTIAPQVAGDLATYRVPQVYIYSVLVLPEG